MIAALKARLSSGPVGTKSIRERKCMEESPAVQKFFFNLGNTVPETQIFENVGFFILQTDTPVRLDIDGIKFTCYSLLVWDQPANQIQITNTDFDTNVQLVVGSRG